MKTGGLRDIATSVAVEHLRVRQIVHVLVYVNQNENLRLVLKFFSATFLPSEPLTAAQRRTLGRFENIFE
jgi:hypothetical protein